MRIVILMLFGLLQLDAQSIGVEYGLSGTENYGSPENTIGVSVSMKVSERMLAFVSYSKWSGEDGNYAYAKRYPGTTNSLSGYYGNVGLNLSLLHKYYNTQNVYLYFGTGFGTYKIMNLDNYNNQYNYFTAAFVLTPLFISWNIDDNYFLYSKGSLGFKPDRYVPDWGTLSIGVSYNPF